MTANTTSPATPVTPVTPELCRVIWRGLTEAQQFALSLDIPSGCVRDRTVGGAVLNRLTKMGLLDPYLVHTALGRSVVSAAGKYVPERSGVTVAYKPGC